ncbi:MAG: GGDEF domain-containing protein [Humidesulfovibrio sp.]|uniref:GGDEF domain-containing protein n=1 Tax=Humidesulfovibrio sp. TaxID=2910988 RepID=UPI0027EB0547|nr:GGDEF domain-containing protein [Humidesulfovibrio sp.]MDQ7836826.1 GGDEF domain-containing protein [Humidesulfovibrio sp.]
MAEKSIFSRLRKGRLGLLNLLRLYSLLLLLLPAIPAGLLLLYTNADILHSRINILLLLCLTLPIIASAVLGHAIVRALLAPLKLLLEGAEKVENGDYGHTIDLSDHPGAPEEMVHLVGAFNRMSETVRRHVDTIQATSRTDQLTGICNRRHLLAEGYRIINMAIRSGKPCCCLMLDIDHFKQVNDNHGHPVGDRYLIHIAGCIASATRDSDLTARYGGEEFVVLAPNANLAEARTLAERIRIAVAETPLKVPSGILNNTVSIGVAEYSMEPEYGANILEDMIEKADKALYRAKQFGRNRVETWPFPQEPSQAP